MEGNPGKQTTPPPSKSVLGSIVRYLDLVVLPVTRYGSYISAFMLAAMMFLIFVDTIFGRLGKWSFINSRTDFFGPIVGGQEIIELLMLVVVSFALAYCASKQGHIRVDLLLQYTSKKTNIWFDIFANAASIIFYLFITWQAFKYGLENIQDKTVSTILTIPISPLNFIIFIGGVLITLVFIRDLLKSVEGIRN